MKLTKSENEKLVIALFKLARMKPTLDIGQKATELANLLDAEHERVEAAEKAAKEPKPPLLQAMEKK